MVTIRPKLHHITSPAVGVLDDRSGTITAANASQVLMAANTERVYWSLQNHSETADLWIQYNGAAVVGQPSIRVGPLETYTPSFIDYRAVQIISDTAAVPFTCKEG
ncbi:hypothetical protein [Prosthecobacter sp.]|uniref:hypothetical protein n=1 Tax=Prosthecobacter sp. TaxID=1965333 RepID=UPI003783C420